MIIQAFINYFCQNRAPLHGTADTTPQQNVDIARFCGRWYELARFDTMFQRGLEEVYAEYTLRGNGRLRIVNCGTNAKGHKRCACAGARIPDRNTPGLLRVSFIPPYRWFCSDYRILFVDKGYRIALVSGADSRRLWLLARSPFIPATDFYTLLRLAQTRGFNTEGLHITYHHPQGALPWNGGQGS